MQRLKDYNKTLPILEIYTAIQSEGSRAGYPTIVIRTTGCTHRCYFGEGGWCDSWYTSIHPEKGMYCFNDIIKIYEENPHITEMMITGGSPTMHPILLNELTHFAYANKIFTTIETEGSHFIATDYPINLLSISPKFNNSIPVVGAKTPLGNVVDERMVKQHNKFRMNVEAIADSMLFHKDFHIKPVMDKDLYVLDEVELFLEVLAHKLVEKNYGASAWTGPVDILDARKILKLKTWCMPAGDDRESLMESYGPVMNMCRDKGYKFTGREHIIAFNTERCV